MELTEIFKMGASLIQGSSDSTIDSLDGDSISTALSNLLSDENGSLDLGSLVSNFSSNGLSDVVGSWLGSGENELISAEQISGLFSEDKISEFASSLGIDEENARVAIADALPNIIDNATVGEGSIVDTMLDKVGGVDGAMSMLSKIFR
jgi:uncharacterized protein YidB (DUF937 family)